MRNLSFIHRFEAGGSDRPPLLLLHGTGGDEADLLPLGRRIAPDASLLSPRGQVLEGGMPRFFCRLAKGVFDEDDLRQRTDDLAAFVADARAAYGLPAPIAVGFSNGANIAAALLLLRPDVLSGAVLLRAMPPLRQPPKADLAHKPVLLLSGRSDPIVSVDAGSALARTLADAGAELEHHVLPASHGLTAADTDLAATWLKVHGGWVWA